VFTGTIRICAKKPLPKGANLDKRLSKGNRFWATGAFGRPPTGGGRGPRSVLVNCFKRFPNWPVVQGKEATGIAPSKKKPVAGRGLSPNNGPAFNFQGFTPARGLDFTKKTGTGGVAFGNSPGRWGVFGARNTPAYFLGETSLRIKHCYEKNQKLRRRGNKPQQGARFPSGSSLFRQGGKGLKTPLHSFSAAGIGSGRKKGTEGPKDQ